MTFGERIQYLRAQKHISRNELALALGIKYAALSKYEKDERQPDYDTLAQIANYFDVSTDYLLGQTDIPIARKKRLTPLLGTIRAGLPIIADENIEEYIEVPEDFKADFVLRVQGDSMVGAGILEGDLVICKESQVAQSGQIVVALHDLATGFSEATLKYYFNGNGSKPVLKAANPQYQDIKLTEGYRIAGIMVALIREHSPSYLVYQHYLALKDYEEWTEVLEKAIGYGITPQQLSVTLDMQRQMIERIMVDKGKRS